MPPEPGVPVAAYLHQGQCASVAFHCQDCATIRRVPLQVVLGRLRALGLDPATTGIRTLWRHARRPCEGCGGLYFETRPDWHSVPGADGMTPAP